jgi:hypothetical protein
MDLERRIDAFLGDGPNRAPAHLLGQTLRVAAATRQVGRPWWRWRLGRGPRRDLVFALAGAGAALVLGGLLLRSGLLLTPGPTASAVPGTTPSVTASPPSPSPSPTPSADPLVFSSEEMGFSARAADAAHHAVQNASVPVCRGVMFPVGSLVADVYQYEIIVCAGDPELGVQSIDGGPFIRGLTLDALEAEFRNHFPDASAAEPVEVDGEPARLVFTTQDRGSGSLGQPAPGPVAVPRILVLHGGRPYVIGWRDGFLPGEIDRRAYLLNMFVPGFHFVRAVATETPTASPISGRVQAGSAPVTVDVTGWTVAPRSGAMESLAITAGVMQLENHALYLIGAAPRGTYEGIWLLRTTAYARIFAVPPINGTAATLANSVAASGTGVDITHLTLPAGPAALLSWTTQADQVLHVVYLVDVNGTLIRLQGSALPGGGTPASDFLALARTLEAP